MISSASQFYVAEPHYGAATVEYGILLAVIAAVCVVMVGSIGNTISQALENVESGF